VLETAARLFFEHGYRAIGVDTIAAESGAGKMTLYRHFPSKDDLIVAYLREMNARFWAWFDESTAQAETPRDKLAAFFKALAAQANKPTCYGCPFLNVATEFPERDHPGHQVALEHKQAVRARFRQLAKQAGARKPDVLADQLFVLMDGAFMAARMYGPDNPALRVAQAAEALIEAQTD
jgi:AcrR family transcriptional regulator